MARDAILNNAFLARCARRYRLACARFLYVLCLINRLCDLRVAKGLSLQPSLSHNMHWSARTVLPHSSSAWPDWPWRPTETTIWLTSRYTNFCPRSVHSIYTTVWSEPWRFSIRSSSGINEHGFRHLRGSTGLDTEPSQSSASL